MIPCTNCLVLGACKTKETIICDLLVNYMRKNTKYENIHQGKLLKGKEIWNEVDGLFQKEGYEVWIKPSDGERDDFTVVSKDCESRRSEV